MNVLKAAGIAVVFSGGNQGALGSVSPGDNPASFAVGSVDASLNISTTSSRGPLPVMAASSRKSLLRASVSERPI
jgi:hypothetical protein